MTRFRERGEGESWTLPKVPLGRLPGGDDIPGHLETKAVLTGRE